MTSLKAEQKVKIDPQEHQTLQRLIEQKDQTSANTQFTQEIKVKLQTKCDIKKMEHPLEYQSISQNLASNTHQDQTQTNQGSLQPQKKKRRRILSHHDRIQEVKTVARTFIQYGLNFRTFNQFYPEIDSKFYRNTVQAINNTAINEIQKFLRYECNILIEKLNRDQKRSIRTQLTKVREWLSKKDMDQLSTLYKFIQRKYDLVPVQISIQEAIKLYKTILQIVKSPFINIMQENPKPESLNPQAHKKASEQERESQEKTLIFLYIQHKNITKVSDLLCEKFGYTLKWSKHAVKQKIKYLLRSSLKKLIGSVEAYDKHLKLYFSQSEECIQLLVKNERAVSIKSFLLQFYLQSTITLIQLKQYIKNVNKFFIREHQEHGQYECKKFEQTVKIPKLQEKNQDFKNPQEIKNSQEIKNPEKSKNPQEIQEPQEIKKPQEMKRAKIEFQRQINEEPTYSASQTGTFQKQENENFQSEIQGQKEQNKKDAFKFHNVEKQFPAKKKEEAVLYFAQCFFQSEPITEQFEEQNKIKLQQ